MARGDKIRADRFGILRQPAELQPVVAPHAGIGRAAAVVFADEIIDDPAEILLEIQHVKRNAQNPRHAPGIGGIQHRAASLLALADGSRRHRRGFHAVRRAEPQEYADDFVPLAQQKRRGDGAIHSAAHGDDDFARFAGMARL